MKRFLLAAALAFATVGAASAATYQIDPRHTQVFFTYSHHGYANLSGMLTGATGRVEFDSAKPGASSVQVELPMSTIVTGVPKLDAHLASADFFEVEKYPTASFRSTKVEVLAKDRFAVTGDMTIHGVTKPVTLAVSINRLGEHSDSKAPMAGFEATGTIKRSEFGVDRMLPGVADEIQLRISTETRVRKAEPAPAPAPAAKG